MLSAFAKKHLFRIRYYIAFAALVYFSAIYLGYIFGSVQSAEADKIIEEFRKMAESVKDASPLGLFAFILLKNAIAAFIAIFSGIIFGIMPLIALVSNGMFLGIIAYTFIRQTASALIFAAGILPHGVIEIPAFLFSAATGLWLGAAVSKRIILRERGVAEKLAQAVNFYFWVVVPMLFLAAVIEAFVTPAILAAIR